MSITLTHFEPFGNHTLEITVKYDKSERIVLDVVSIFVDFDEIRTDLLSSFISVSEFDVAVNKIIDRVDWAELYAETVNQ